LSPAVLSIVRHIATAGQTRPGRIAFCGEMAGRPLEAITLVGLGIRSLSMQAANIGPVKQAIRALDTRMIQPVIAELSGVTAASARKPLAEFAAANGIPV
jgi:phosphotransferase system enzyme I (PtsP)